LNKGLKTNGLTLLPTLFKHFSNGSFWKVDFIVNYNDDNNNKTSTGMSSLILKTNSLPLNGECKVDLLQGISLLTYFTIACSNWTDSDGEIVKYEFMGIKYIFFNFKSLFVYLKPILQKKLHIGDNKVH